MKGQSGRYGIEPYTLAGRVIDPLSGKLVYADGESRLTSRQVLVLDVLLSKQGEVVSRRELIDLIWEGNYLVGDRGLTDAIYQLRKVLQDDDENPLIKTVPRRGYLVHEGHEVALTSGVVTALKLKVGAEIPGRSHWILVEQLGCGGAGEVWRAQHQKTLAERVFKFCDDLKQRRALQREVTLFRLIRSQLGEREDIAPLLEWNFEEAPYFIEMEYFPSRSLEHWIAAQGGFENVPEATRLQILADVCSALAAAHSLGVVHKDLKPANLLIDDSSGYPQPMLADFGVGLLTDEEVLGEANITRMGLTQPSTGGTPIYTAPEIWEGRPASAQSDLYALGVLMYQMSIGDFSRALPANWQADIVDPLRCDDIAAAVGGEPGGRISAADLADRLRNYSERSEAFRHAAKTNARRRRIHFLLRSVAIISPLLLLLIVLLATEYRRAEANAVQVSRQLQISENTVGFLVSLIERIDPLDAQAGRVDINRVIDDGVTLIDDRFSADPETRYRLLMPLAAMKFSIGYAGESQALYESALRSALELKPDPLEEARIRNGITAAAVRQELLPVDSGIALPAVELLEAHGLTRTEEYFWAKTNQGGLRCRWHGPLDELCLDAFETARQVATALADDRLISANLHSRATRLLEIDPEGALTEFERSFALVTPAWGDDHEMSNHVRMHLAEAYQNVGRYGDAYDVYVEAAESSARVYGGASPSTIRAEMAALAALGMSGSSIAIMELEDFFSTQPQDSYPAFEAAMGLAAIHGQLGNCGAYGRWIGAVDVRPLSASALGATVIWRLHEVLHRMVDSHCPDAIGLAAEQIVRTGLRDHPLYTHSRVYLEKHSNRALGD